MFNCKVCHEKDKRITDLLTQVEMLRALALPKQDAHVPSIRDYEADAILSGSDDPIADEADAILTASYDNSLQVEIE